MEEPTASNTTPGSRAGSRFGHYRLIRLLGWGGFGEVYEAEDTVMDRAVALKLLAAPYSQNEVFRLRLYSLESIAAQVVRQNPGLTPQLATVFVDTALSVYCPQGDY